MTFYEEGDEIVLKHENGSRLVGEVRVSGDDEGAEVKTPVEKDSAELEWYFHMGWTVESHTPSVKLPEENGVYVVKETRLFDGPVVFVNYGGHWRSTPETKDAKKSALSWAKLRGLERLDPEKARKDGQRDLLDYIDNEEWRPGEIRLLTAGDVADLRKKFDL